MTTIRTAFYARVSGEQQAAAHTIESQISALSERASSDGMPVPPERQFVDEGYSGAALIRPSLDRVARSCEHWRHRPDLRPLTRPARAQLRVSSPIAR